MPEGRLNWLEIPAADVEESARFYEAVFGWTLDRTQDPDYPMFTDSSGGVGGAFVTWREPTEDGILPYVAVPDIDATLRTIGENGGSTIKEKTPIVEGKDWFAVARDPAGNALGLYQEA